MRKVRRFLQYYQDVIIVGCVIVVFVTSLFVGLIPAYKNMTEKQKKMNVFSGELTRLKEKERILSSYDIAVLENNYEVLLSAIPKTMSVSSFMSTIDALVNQNALSFTSFTIEGLGKVSTQSAGVKKPDEQKFGASIVSATISVEGSLESIRGFLDSVGRIRRLLRTKTFNLAFVSRGGIYSCQMSLSAFYAPAPASMGKITDALPSLDTADQEAIKTIAGFPLLGIEEVLPNQPATLTPLKQDPFSL